MQDYSQILTRGDGGQPTQGRNDNPGNTGQGNGQSRSRNRGRNRNRNTNVNNDTDLVVSGTQGGGQQQVNFGGVQKRTKFALANSLGTSAEVAKNLGISRRQAHRIVDIAYQSGSRS